MSKPEALIFDLDGTLIQTGHMLEEAFIATFGEHAIELEPERFRSWISSESRSLSSLHPQGDSIAGLLEEVDKHYLHNISKHGVEWLEGVVEEIQKLGELLPLAVFTNAPRSYVQAASQWLPIQTFFQHIVTFDDVAPNGKPQPDGILLCCQSLSVKPVRCIYVGDHVLDMMTAKAAGSTAVLIPSDVTNASAREKADRVYSNISEIYKRLL